MFYFALFLQLGQTSFSFNLSQLQQTQLGGQSFTQQNLFLPTTPTQPDPYQASQVPSFPRNPPQPYGQTPSQQNTLMVSSATSSQMSSAIKAPTQAGFGESDCLVFGEELCGCSSFFSWYIMLGFKKSVWLNLQIKHQLRYFQNFIRGHAAVNCDKTCDTFL